MREILFRGKRENGEWIEGYYERYGKIHRIIVNDTCVSFSRPVVPETVGQFTGLKDKNGAKIFEGDIIKIDVPFSKVRRNIIGLIEVSKSSFSVTIKMDGADYFPYLDEYDTDAIEVIGNVFDNPELLEE